MLRERQQTRQGLVRQRHASDENEVLLRQQILTGGVQIVVALRLPLQDRELAFPAELLFDIGEILQWQALYLRAHFYTGQLRLARLCVLRS